MANQEAEDLEGDDQVYNYQVNEQHDEMLEHQETLQQPKTTRRLMIKEIIMCNFKSYYGERKIGPLHKNFTTIVGPNGSGKSNMIECLLFVFGKRAKKMRVSTNIGDLIHNSSQHQDVLHAFVQINFQYIEDHIDDEELFEVIEGTQFSVKREIRRPSVGDK